MLSAESQIFFGSKCSFFPPVGRPLDSAHLGGRSTCPHPQYLRHWMYWVYKPPFLFSGGARVQAPPLHCHARRCRYTERPLSYRGSSDPQQVPGVACLLSQASCQYFTAAFFGCCYDFQRVSVVPGTWRHHGLSSSCFLFLFAVSYAHISTWDFMLFKVVRSCGLLVFIVFISFLLHFLSSFFIYRSLSVGRFKSVWFCVHKRLIPVQYQLFSLDYLSYNWHHATHFFLRR